MKWGNISTNIATLEKIAGMGLFFSYRVTFTADRCKLKTTAIRPINATGPYIFFSWNEVSNDSNQRFAWHCWSKVMRGHNVYMEVYGKKLYCFPYRIWLVIPGPQVTQWVFSAVHLNLWQTRVVGRWPFTDTFEALTSVRRWWWRY